MKSNCVRALCLGAAGVLVISSAVYGNNKKDDSSTSTAARVIERNTEKEAALSDTEILMTAGVASMTATALADEDAAATVSDTSMDLVTQAQDTASVYGYTNLGIAVVDSGNLNVRQAPGTDADLVGKMPNHAACEVLGVDGEWTQIQSGEVTGYVKSEYLVTGEEATALAEEVKETVAKVTTTTLYVREEPNTDCSIVTSMPMGEELEVIEQLDGWVRVAIDSDEGYVSADYVEVNTELPTAMTMTEVRYGQGVSDVRVDLVSYACQFVGNPYVWGGTSLTRGADCSGFVLSVFANYGVSLPHSSVAQSNSGTKISASEAQPGDLFFYGNGSRINHVAIYIGNGQVVHASSPRTGIKISGAYYRNPVKVVRILQN